MSILVVNPPNKPFTNDCILAEPIDAMMIATVIKQEFNDVKLIDMDVYRMDNNINPGYGDVVVFVYDYQLPLHTSETIQNIYEIIKNYDNKKIKTIMIGKSASYLHKEYLENGVDIVIEGEAEDRINDVIRNITSDDLMKIRGIYTKCFYTGKHSSKVDYSSLPIVDRGTIDLSKYNDVRTIITSRGCNGTCNFCTTPFFFGKWRAKSAADVIAEIEYLINECGAKKIMFLDDNFTVDKTRVLEICQMIIDRKLDIRFGCLSSIANYDVHIFRTMYKAGFRWVHFGIESGSKRILNLMLKNIDIEHAKKVIEEVKGIGFRIRTSYILDYPTQKLDELSDTIKLIHDLNTDEIRLHFLTKRYGTPLYVNGENNQYIHSNKSVNLNNKENAAVEDMLYDLKIKGYKIIKEEIKWNDLSTTELKKMVSLTPMKYGVNWDD